MPDPSDPRCLICGSPEHELRYRITRFQVLQCQICAQIYLYPLLSPEEIRDMFAQLYTTGEGSVPELKTYYGFTYDDDPGNPLVQLYESYLARIEAVRPPGRLLDIGCGTGLFLAVARRRGWEPFGIDDSVDATKHARDHFGLDVWVGEFADFPAADRRFDAITGWDIIEHSREPVSLLRTMRDCLAPGGVIGLSTPNQRNVVDLVAGTLYRLSAGMVKSPLEKFYIEQHFLYFTPETLRGALDRGGLEALVVEQEGTDLRRLTLSPVMRLGLTTLFLFARVAGLETRLFALARAKDGARADA